MLTERTGCCIAGGGPAGMVLGYVLARQGVDVVVLEKHADFLRDFRGDTVHPSTLRLLDELGLGEDFFALPHQEVPRLGVSTDEGSYVLADFTRLPGAHRYVVLVPQWDFLDFLADHGRAQPTFRLRMGSEAVDLLHENGAVLGVRYRTSDGEERELRADLTVAADGRGSVLRAAAGLALREFGAPMDVLWFRLPKPADAPAPSFGGLGRLTRGRLLVQIDRGNYWQCAFLVPKGGAGELRAAGLDSFRAELADLLPGRESEIQEIDDWAKVRELSVRVDRLRRWHRPGLLVIGDAAHAMSPIGGVGINLAVQDAAAAARILGPVLRERPPTPGELGRVRRRRLLPTVLTQRVQRLVQDRFLRGVLAGDRPVGTPRVLRVLQRFPVLQGIPARLMGLGVLPEHAPPSLRGR